MARDFLPRVDAELVNWSRTFSARLSQSPERFGVSVERAEAFGVLQAEWESAFMLADAPTTRTASAVAAKNAARARMKDEARRLNSRIRASSPTGGELIELGLKVFAPKSKIGAPAEPPSMSIVSANGWRAIVQLRALASNRSGKPAGVSVAELYITYDDAPIAGGKQWRFFMQSSRNRFAIDFPSDLPVGTRVHLCARWKNPRLMPGPTSAATSFILGGGVPRTAM